MKKLLVFLMLFSLVQFMPAQQRAEGTKTIVAAAEVVEANDIQERRYTGSIVSPAVVNIVSRVSGDLLEVGFSEGDYVKKGQLLYSINPIRYEAAVKSAQAEIAQSEAKLSYSKNTFDRVNALFEKSVSTKDAWESARSAYEAIQAGLEISRASLILANDDLNHTKIYSPIDGKIGLNNYTPGNYITPNSGILSTVIQLDPIRLKFSISNRDYLAMFGSPEALKSKGTVTIILADDSVYSIGGKPVEGELEFIDNTANRTTDTIQVYFKIANPDFCLIPQSTVKVLLKKDNHAMIPAVSPTAVMNDGTSAYVYVLDESNTVSRRNVKMGSISGEYMLIPEGLKKGERVVTSGTHKIRPGANVTIQNENN